MITVPMDILRQYPVRKSKKQKQAFRDDILHYATQLGYPASVEKGSFGSHNVILGDPEKAEYLVTAHYDTCARLPVPNLLTPCNFWAFLGYQLVLLVVIFVPALFISAAAGLITDSFEVGYFLYMALLWASIILMLVGPANPSNVNDNTSGVVTVLETAAKLPPELRKRVCFVLFDLEEAGLIGSSTYRSKHKSASDRQMVLNLDCVGEGDHILLFPTSKLKKDTAKMAALESCCIQQDGKEMQLRRKGFAFYPSDQAQFPYGVGIAALNDSWAGLYLSRIHTPKDTILDYKNVNLLCTQLIALIGSVASE